MTTKENGKGGKPDLPDDGHDLHPILTNKEFKTAQANAIKKIEADRKKAAMEAVEKAEAERLKVEEGLTTGIDAKDEMVTILVDLAEFCDRVTINGRPYWHGHSYTVPRHVGDTLRDIMQRTWLHEHEVSGKSKKAFYNQRRMAEVFAVKKGGSAVISAGDVEA